MHTALGVWYTIVAMTTLTIEIDDELLRRAQELAAARDMTVAQMLQRLLRIVAEPPLRRDELPPLTRRALGVLPPMTDDEVKRVLDEERMRKHGRP